MGRREMRGAFVAVNVAWLLGVMLEIRRRKGRTMPRILSVGQCGFDHASIARHFRKAFNAEVAGADSFGEALGVLRSGTFDLVLINRVTDADSTSGLDLIRSLKADPALGALPVMLVSNYETAQSEAISLGALKGFGKTDLGREPFLTAVESVFLRIK